MSDIDGPSKIPLKTGDGATRVTRASTTSDDSSAQQQPPEKRAKSPERQSEVKGKKPTHETAVTLSSSLSNLQQGARFSAHYDGVDGQGRPLITAESGTYVVKYDPAQQDQIDKLPPNATLEIRILKVDREIEARLHYSAPGAKAAAQPSIALSVVLELTGLGGEPPRISVTAPQGPPESGPQSPPYRTSALYLAENIARESARKIQELPLPTTSANYTLYERAVPRPDRPAVRQSKIAANALIAQEVIPGSSQPPPAAPPGDSAGITPAPAENIAPATPQDTPSRTSAGIIATDIEKLLHKNTLATVVKNFPRMTVALPEIVQKQLGRTDPLNEIKAGGALMVRIESIAIPDQRPATAAQPSAASPENKSPESKPPENRLAESRLAVEARPAAAAPPPLAPNAPALAPDAGFSGIVIDPGRNILQQANKPAAQPNAGRSYQSGYAKSAYGPAKAGNGLQTLYVATPVSVIKFQSPVALSPGTVINFSPAVKAVPPTESAERQSPATPPPATPAAASAETRPTADPAGWTALSFAAPAGSAAAAAPQPPPQPLQDLQLNWLALSQIVAMTAVADGSGAGQALDNRLPTINSPGQMTATLIFFLATLGAKHPARSWLGPDIAQRLEQAGQGKLLKSLDGDMRRIFRMGADTPVNEWRPALIPMQAGGEVTAIPILIRQVADQEQNKNRQSGADDETPDITATRFIVELELSQVGRIQVDGLLKDKKLNIIIRSGSALAPDLKHKIAEKYAAALEISGYDGDLQFRENRPPEISVGDFIDQKIHLLQLNRV